MDDRMTMTEYWNNLQVTTGDLWLKKPTRNHCDLTGTMGIITEIMPFYGRNFQVSEFF